jgi:ketosteroid isomerase-like protein
LAALDATPTRGLQLHQRHGIRRAAQEGEMTVDEVKRIVQSAYAARANEDFEGLARIFSDDVEFRIAGSPSSFPAAVDARGSAALVQSLRMLIETFEFLEQDDGDWVVDDDQAAVRWIVKLRHVPSERVITTEVMDLWTLRDGRVARFVQFTDTALIGGMMAEQSAF